MCRIYKNYHNRNLNDNIKKRFKYNKSLFKRFNNLILGVE